MKAIIGLIILYAISALLFKLIIFIINQIRKNRQKRQVKRYEATQRDLAVNPTDTVCRDTGSTERAFPSL